jgi:hypothetical protein
LFIICCREGIAAGSRLETTACDAEDVFAPAMGGPPRAGPADVIEDRSGDGDTDLETYLWGIIPRSS